MVLPYMTFNAFTMTYTIVLPGGNIAHNHCTTKTNWVWTMIVDFYVNKC